ncbi:MAG: hypothetical protein J07HR59_00313, partial [Halorubrum sp. J07HR59]
AGFETLNPLYNTEHGAGTAIGYTVDQGYNFAPGTEYNPLHYDMSTDNGEVWVFDVREGLQPNGYDEITASDYVYLIEELHKSEWANTANSANWSNITVTETGEFSFRPSCRV